MKAEFRGNGIGRKALDYILAIFFNEWNGNEMLDLIRQENNIGMSALKAYGFQERLNKNNEIILFMNRETFLKNKRF